MKYSKGVMAGTLVMFLAACGSNAPKSTTPPVGHTLTSATTSTPDLNAELLATSDLPAGWSSVPGSDSGPQPKCIAHVVSDLNAAHHVLATFAYGPNGSPYLGELLAYLPGQGQSTVTALSQALSSCGQISFTSTSGGQTLTLTGTIGSLAIPPIADQSSAYQMNLSGNVSGSSVTLDCDVVVFRKADTVALVEYFSLVAPNTQAVQSFVQAAAAKLS